MAEHQAGSLDPAVAGDVRPATQEIAGRRRVSVVPLDGDRDRAARRVRTELICFLDAGVEFTPGAIAMLVDFLDAHPEAAAVAPMVVGPSGEVGESGGVIGGDAVCAPYRADQRALFAREVDHPGVACLLVRRAAFEEVGGFSADYETADLRAADLALALRRHGWQTWEQPAARVVCPRSLDDLADRRDEPRRRSQATFRRRWRAELAGRPPAADLDEHPYRLWWLRDRLTPFRVLLIDDRVPQADRGRGDPRTHAVLEAWHSSDPRARVTFFASSTDGAEECAPALQARGIEVVWGVADAARWARARAGLYDVIVVFRPHNFVRLGEPMARAQPQAVLVYDAEALFHRRAEQYRATAVDAAERERYAAEAGQLRAQEMRAFRWADVAVCVSEEEAAWARQVAPSTPARVVCYRATVPATVPGREQRDGLMFFGGFDSTSGTPNEHAVLELADRLLPVLRRRHPGLTLRIMGADPSPAVLGLSGGPVTVVGKVADPRPELGSALLHVAPMRYGAGVKIKFVESMAAGLPFVTTAVGAEGLNLGLIARYLVGESPAELIERCDALLSDGTLWTDVQQSLVDICRQHFSVERFATAMREVLADCAIPAVRLPLRGSQPAAQ